MQLTGRREPISMSGAWQGRAASYYASGLVLFAVRFAPLASNPRSGVICVRPALPAEMQPNQPEEAMTAQPILTSDIIGLTRHAPLSRRGFMTASAATAAGYTLAAGPVRADVIKTDTNGLIAG